MSRLSRDMVRRDNAAFFLERIEQENDDSLPINLKDKLLDILNDIEVKKIGPIPENFDKRSYIWETICIVARAASIAGIWSVPKKKLQEYLPKIDHQTFKQKWSEIKTHTYVDVLSFLNLLKLNDV